jgi:hypothetical protein
VSPVKYETGFYIPEDDIPHIHRHKNLKSYIASLDMHMHMHMNMHMHMHYLIFFHGVLVS